MKCPYCGAIDQDVWRSEFADNGRAVTDPDVEERECLHCHAVFNCVNGLLMDGSPEAVAEGQACSPLCPKCGADLTQKDAVTIRQREYLAYGGQLNTELCLVIGETDNPEFGDADMKVVECSKCCTELPNFDVEWR